MAEKASVVGGLLDATNVKIKDAASTVMSFVGGSPAPAAGASSSTGLPTWLLPVVLFGAAAFAAVKFLPKLFKKGRGTRSTTRRR